MPAIRAPTADDAAAFFRLWDGYNEFYHITLPDAVSQANWRRCLAGTDGMVLRLAEHQGMVAGFALVVLHPTSWRLEPDCHLEDLFVAPVARRHGLGAALIDDLLALGRACGWGRIYWHTETENRAARRLYDRYVTADDFVRYRRDIGPD